MDCKDGEVHDYTGRCNPEESLWDDTEVLWMGYVFITVWMFLYVFFFLSIYPNSYHLTSEYIFQAGHLGLFVLGLLKSFHGSHSNEMHTLSKNLHSKNKYLITY